MVWAKIDDEILDNPKVARAGVIGFAVHMAAIVYCCRNLTDGFIPFARVSCLLDLSATNMSVHDKAVDSELPAVDPHDIAEWLVECKLWEDVSGGYQIHDFLQWNPSKEKVLAERQRGAERAKASHASRKAVTKTRGNLAASSPEDAPKTRRDFGSVSPGPVPVPDPVPKKIPDPPLAGAHEGTVVVDNAELLAADARSVWDANTMTRRPTDEAEAVWTRFTGNFTDKTFTSRKALLGRWRTWILDQCKYDEEKRQREASRPVSQIRSRNADRQPHDEGWLKRMREREAAGTGTDDPFGGGT